MKKNQEVTQKTKVSLALTHAISPSPQGSATFPPLIFSLFNPAWHFNGNVPIEAGEHILDYLDAKTLGLTTPRINKAWRALTEEYLKKHPAVQKEVEEERASRKAEAKRKKEEERQARTTFQQLYDKARELFESAELKANIILSLSSTSVSPLTVSTSNQENEKELGLIVSIINQVEAYLAGKEDQLTFKGALQVATKLPQDEKYITWMQGFELLGDVYQQRGILQKDERQLLKAVTLYNLALCSQERYEEIVSNSSRKKGISTSCIAKIKGIEELLITHYSGNVIIQTKESYWQPTEEAKQALMELRHQVINKIQTVELSVYQAQLEQKVKKGQERKIEETQAATNKNGDGEEEKEKDHTESIEKKDKDNENSVLSIQTIYHRIAIGLKEEVIKPLIKSCQIFLPIPKDCVYSINFLGSFARSEATPYSDFECAVLLQDQGEEKNKLYKAYMRQLITLLWIKILNLGETSARMMDITSLSWLSEQDSPARKGFSFDGQMEDGCHTPLGNIHHTQRKVQRINTNQSLTEEDKVKERQKVYEGEYELIGTPQELAAFQEDRWVCKRGFGTVLSTVEPIISNDRKLGKSLTTLYEEEMEKIWNERIEGSDKTVLQKRSLSFLAESVERFQFRGGRFDEEVHYFDAKYHLYRLPNMVLDHLAGYFGVRAKNIWDKIEGIFGERGWVINKLGNINLKDIMSVILLIRLTAYLKKGYRDDHILMLDPNYSDKNQALLTNYLGIHPGALLHIYSVIIFLQEVAKSFIEQKGSSQTLSQSSFFADSPFVRAYIYELLLDYEQAAKAYEEAKHIAIALHGAQHVLVAMTLFSIGNVYQAQGRYDDAIGAYEEAKRIYIEVNGPRHDSVASTLNNLGLIYRDQGRYIEATGAYKEAKRICMEVNGSQHVSVATILNNLGTLYEAQGCYAKALKVLEKAKHIDMTVYGSHHISTQSTMGNIGSIYQAQGRYAEAIEVLKEVKRIYLKVYGPQHVSVATALNNLGSSYKAQERYVDAITAFEEAKRIYIAVHGPNHRLVVITLQSLGNVFVELKQFGQARIYYQQALAICAYSESSSKKEIQASLQLSYVREGNDWLLKEPMDIEAAKVCYQQSGADFDCIKPGPHQYLAEQAYRANNLKVARECARILIKLDPNNASAYHNLGCYTHVQAQIEKDKGDEVSYHTYLTEAEGYFETAIKLDAHAGIYTEFAQFMLRNQLQYPISRIIDNLQKAIALKQEVRELRYSVMERSTVDFNFQSLIDEQKAVSFSAYLLAHYLLIQTYLINHQIQEAQLTLSRFEGEVAQSKQTYEKSRADLVNFAECIISLFPENETQAQLEQLQSQLHALDKEQQLLGALLTFSQQAIAACNPSVAKQPANNNSRTEEIIDTELEAAIKLSLTSPSSKRREGESCPEEHALISTQQLLETKTKVLNADEDAKLQAAITLSLTKTNEEDRDKKDSAERDTRLSFSSEEKPLGNAVLSNRVGSRTRSPLHSRSASPPLETVNESTSQGLTQRDEREHIKREIIKHMTIIKVLIEPRNMGENIVPSFVEEVVKPQLQCSEEMLVGEYEVAQWQEQLVALKACGAILKDCQKASTRIAMRKL